MTTKKRQRAFLTHGTTPRYLFPFSLKRFWAGVWSCRTGICFVQCRLQARNLPDDGICRADGTHRRGRKHSDARDEQSRRFRTCIVGQRADADNTVSGAVARTPEGPTTTALWCPDTRGVDDRLPHIHYNRLDLHILIHPLFTTFAAQTTFFKAAEGDFMGVAGGIVDADEAVIQALRDADDARVVVGVKIAGQAINR